MGEEERTQFEEAFKPIALEIGLLTRSWNALHEHLGMTFAAILSPQSIAVPLAVWHSTQNDRAQREMLRAAVSKWYPGKELDVYKGEIKFILHNCESLSDKRNDAIHMPLNILRDCSTFAFSVKPNDIYGHSRASRFKGRDLLSEFAHFKNQVECMEKYCVKLWVSLTTSEPLPERPVLPSSEASRSRKAPDLPAPRRSPKRPPQSSQE